MGRIEVTSTVGTDGVLRLHLPLSPAEAGRDVRVTVEPVPPPAMSVAAWHAFVDRTAGSISDPEFRRREQGEYEEREPLP